MICLMLIEKYVYFKKKIFRVIRGWKICYVCMNEFEKI